MLEIMRRRVGAMTAVVAVDRQRRECGRRRVGRLRVVDGVDLPVPAEDARWR
jgi:hypothetical protein